MAILPLVLLIFAFVLFVLAAFPVVEPWRWRLIPAGLACWVMAVIFTTQHLLA